MLDRTKLELTIQEIARQRGETLDNHARYTIRNGVEQVLQARERHQHRMSAPVYQWKKPKSLRR